MIPYCCHCFKQSAEGLGERGRQLGRLDASTHQRASTNHSDLRGSSEGLMGTVIILEDAKGEWEA